jgi:hypothetical protein
MSIVQNRVMTTGPETRYGWRCDECPGKSRGDLFTSEDGAQFALKEHVKRNHTTKEEGK